jgi:hypothetical protein
MELVKHQHFTIKTAVLQENIAKPKRYNLPLLLGEPLDISTNLAPTALYSYAAINRYLHGSFCVFSCLIVDYFFCLVLGDKVSLI